MAKRAKRGLGQPTHPLWSDEWYAWKEQHFDYRPYHMGTSPGGKPCPNEPSCRSARGGSLQMSRLLQDLPDLHVHPTGPLPYSEES